MIIFFIILNLFLVNSFVFDPFHLLSKSNICDCDLELTKLSEKTQEIVQNSIIYKKVTHFSQNLN